MNHSSVPARFVMAGLLLVPFEFARGQQLADDISDLNVRLRTKHYALAGTVTDDRLERYARALEAIYAQYESGFGNLFQSEGKEAESRAPTARRKKRSRRDGRPTAPGSSQSGKAHDADHAADAAGAAGAPGPAVDDRFRVILFAREEEFRELGRKYFGKFSEHTIGIFSPSARALLIIDHANAQHTDRVLYHEAFHQFIHRYVPHVPVWLNEGLATHYGTARLTDYEILFDKRDQNLLRIVRDAANRRKLVPLDELMSLRHADFYAGAHDEDLDVPIKLLHYGESYSLVAYLLSIPDGRALLRRYIKQLAEARTPQQVNQITRRTFSKRVTGNLIPGWMRFVKGR